jgi:hypothetical protein
LPLHVAGHMVSFRQPCVAAVNPTKNSEKIAFRHPIEPVADGLGGRFVSVMAVSWDKGTAMTRPCQRTSTSISPELASRQMRAYCYTIPKLS